MPDMSGPGWLTGMFAGLMITVAVYCAGRLVVARRWRRPTEVDADGGHVVMGVAMAGMLEAGLRFGPAGIWEAVFAGAGAWFAWQVVRVRRGAPLTAWRCPQPLPHLVECGAMLYMFLALPAAVAVRSAAGGMGGMSAPATESRFSPLALVLALFMFGWVVSVGDRLTLRAPALAARVVAVPVPASAVRVASAAPAVGPQDSGPLMTAVGPEHAGTVMEPPQAGCGGTSPGRPFLAPRCAAMCKIAMGITMGYMLILML
jgi:hypothetical protein